jgi:hypothetical protein
MTHRLSMPQPANFLLSQGLLPVPERDKSSGRDVAGIFHWLDQKTVTPAPPCAVILQTFSPIRGPSSNSVARASFLWHETIDIGHRMLHWVNSRNRTPARDSMLGEAYCYSQ